MPALLKAFFEQALRPGFAMSTSAKGGWTKLLSGRSARVVVTMGMPAFVYRHRSNGTSRRNASPVAAASPKPVCRPWIWTRQPFTDAIKAVIGK